MTKIVNVEPLDKTLDSAMAALENVYTKVYIWVKVYINTR